MQKFRLNENLRMTVDNIVHAIPQEWKWKIINEQLRIMSNNVMHNFTKATASQKVSNFIYKELSKVDGARGGTHLRNGRVC